MSTVGVNKKVKVGTLLQVTDLKKYFPLKVGGILNRVTAWIKAVDGVDFAIPEHETFGLVGESGCGKTTVSRLILLLERPTAGCIYFEGKDIASLKEDSLREYRYSMQVVFQDPTSALNPRVRVKEIVSEPLTVTRCIPNKVVEERVEEMLTKVELNPATTSLYPHELSGGQRQRIAIARALIARPKCIILDEPVSSLDVSIRAQILNLLLDLQAAFGVAYLMIAHDLHAVSYLSSKIGVMYLGKLVEIADAAELYSKPLHPYTQALLSAALPWQLDGQHQKIVLTGEIPSSLNLPVGCRFHPRCRYSKPVCSEAEPPMKEVDSGREIACHLYI
jgi:oligopeptide/dipeptide ABC transporter ATP-binding protein